MWRGRIKSRVLFTQRRTLNPKPEWRLERLIIDSHHHRWGFCSIGLSSVRGYQVKQQPNTYPSLVELMILGWSGWWNVVEPLHSHQPGKERHRIITIVIIGWSTTVLSLFVKKAGERLSWESLSPLLTVWLNEVYRWIDEACIWQGPKKLGLIKPIVRCSSLLKSQWVQDIATTQASIQLGHIAQEGRHFLDRELRIADGNRVPSDSHEPCNLMNWSFVIIDPNQCLTWLYFVKCTHKDRVRYAQYRGTTPFGLSISRVVYPARVGTMIMMMNKETRDNHLFVMIINPWFIDCMHVRSFASLLIAQFDANQTTILVRSSSP